MTAVRGFRLIRLSLPLHVPYKLSYRTFTEFEPFVVIVLGDDGAIGFGEGHISPGSSSETRDGGWQFLKNLLPQLPSMAVATATSLAIQHHPQSPVAVTAIITALEMLAGHASLVDGRALSLPLVSPVNGSTQTELEPELEGRLDEGYRTFKVKVGLDADQDLKRLKIVQSILDDRARLRIDANRGFSVAAAIRFATLINPASVELFEQPCDANDWDGNAAVAKVSRVPLMLDEPIGSLDDIRRAGGIEGVGFCKVKLKRFGSINALLEAISLIRECGMTPVLGDGLGADIGCWIEACVARDHIDNAGEFNGYLKTTTPLFKEPLGFADGCLTMPAGHRTALDCNALDDAMIDEYVGGSFAVP